MTASSEQIVQERPALRSVGKHIERPDAEEKIDGTVEYADDLEFPDIKYAKICRSTVPHGFVTAIDTSEAEALTGVEKIVTRDDIYRLAEEEGFNPYFGPAIKDQPVLALEKVHYIGDPVAAVVADSEDIAEEAVNRIHVEYDELDFSSTVEEALEADAPILHEEFEAADTFPDLEQVTGGRETNEAFQFNLRKGDVEAAFDEAAHLFENTYRTPAVQHMPFEPFVSIARIESDGCIHLWTPTQSPHFVRNELASMFDVPESKVRVEVPQIGGSYGAKLYTKTEPLVAVCAHLTGHTVKLRQSIEESFATITRHETKVRLKTAVDTDGRLIGRKCDVFYDTGAYAEIGPRITKKSGYTAAGPYEIPHVWIDSHCVYTNKPPAGAFRGFGVPQLVAAYEAQMDRIAAELGIDPLEIRTMNGYTEGSTHSTGAVIESVGLMECIDAVAEAVDWHEPVDQPDDAYLARGKGIACGYKACITPSSSGALLIMHGDGSVTVHSSSVEIGQGVQATLAQIVAEALELPIGLISVSQPDTDQTPFDTITAGSRSTFHMGNAVVQAAEDLKTQLRAVAAKRWGVAPTDVVVRSNEVRRVDTESTMTYAETIKSEFGSAGGTLIGRGYFTSEGGHHDPDTGLADNPTVFWFFGATSAVVDVDIETGKLDVKELHNAADVGKAIDPERVKAQILGGATHALGQTLSEEMVFEFGQQINQTLLDYKMPSIEDMPDVLTNHVIEVEHPHGPFGAKGVGETGSFAVSPAIVNAVRNATGASISEIPLTPERVLRGIEGGEL